MYLGGVLISVAGVYVMYKERMIGIRQKRWQAHKPVQENLEGVPEHLREESP